MKLEISYEKGNKRDGDRKIKVETDGKEPITIFRLGLLVNQLAVNEAHYANDYDWDNMPFFFGKFISRAAEQGKEGIDWADKEFEGVIKNLCREYQLFDERIDHDLLKRTQTRLTEFLEGEK